MTTRNSGLHEYTPTLSVIDPRGLVVRSIACHRWVVDEPIAERVQRQVFNAKGDLCQQWDPRLFELSDFANQSTCYSLSGQVLLTESVDAGWRLACHDAAGQLRDSWDGRDTHRRYAYDELMRPVKVFEHEPPLCVACFTYAGADEEAARHNRCGQLLRHDDQAGSLWHEAFALTGKPLSETRRFCTTLAPPQWPASEADLEDIPYSTRWRHDALSAVIEQIDALEHVQRFEFDVAGQPFASWLDDVALLKSTTYNAFGHVESELAGNDVTTTAFYSARDGLLSNLKAKRSDGKTLQDLHYQYDPVGNITRIEDLAQPVQWFTGQRIQAVSTYTYDTLYQLISATGRENASQTIGPGLPGLEIFGPVDDSRWRTYSQTYSYDSGGNLTRLKHAGGAGNSYTREMVVDARSNRSLFNDGSPIDFAKAFDANGNQQALAPGQLMQWDSRNQLQHVTQVQRDQPDGQDDDTETYVYDGGGQRVRKVRRAKTRGGEHISEVRYLPGLEIRSRTTGEHLHVVLAQAGRNTVRLLNRENGEHQYRYSVNDHLGSSTLELDQHGELLSQESYYPYGGTAWWAAKSALEARYKVVRYSGKEKDATGLYYYGFRYYTPWLQRWINPDPAGDVDGLNLFKMVENNPSSKIDILGLRPPISEEEAREISTNIAGNTPDDLPLDLRLIDFSPDAMSSTDSEEDTSLPQAVAGADDLMKRVIGEQWPAELANIAVAEAASKFTQLRSATVFNHQGVVIKSLLQGATQAVLFSHGGMSPHRKKFRKLVTVPQGRAVHYYSSHFEDTNSGIGMALLRADALDTPLALPAPKETIEDGGKTRNYRLTYTSEGFELNPTKNYDVIFIEPQTTTPQDFRTFEGNLDRVFAAVETYRPQISQIHAIHCRAVFNRERQRIYE